MTNYEVDYSDLVGKKVECPEECGMCCLCQPEVLPLERAYFRQNHPKELVKSNTSNNSFALALKKGRGSCVFLNNRRCKIYEHRTAYCRQFPYHIYVGDKIKVELDLSCRGAWTGNGNDAVTEAKDLIEKAQDRIKQTFPGATSVYKQFYDNCRETGVLADLSVLRMSVSENLGNFTDLGYISKVLELCELEPVLALSNVRGDPKYSLEDLEEAAMGAALNSLSTDDPVSVPVYCDKDWNWNMFMANEESIVWNIMDNEGDLHKKGEVKLTDIKLKQPDQSGMKVLADYVAILNGRDSFAGSVFSLMDETNYEDDMSNAYYGCLSTTILDLLWRMALLDHFLGTGFGAEGMKEAIIFYDMDRMDAPTIGAFI